MSTTTAQHAAAEASPTPILDRLAPLPEPHKPRRSTGIVASLVSILCICSAIVLMSLHPAFEASFFRWVGENLSILFKNDWAGVRVILTGFAIVLAVLAAVVIHECGHLLAGWAVGLRFRLLRVGPLQVDRNLHVSRFKTSDGDGLGWTLFFTEEMRNRPMAVACMTFAGPLANLVSAWLVVMLPFHKSLVSGAFVMASLFFGLANLIPFRSARITSDGMHLLMLLWNRSKHERRLALARIFEDQRVELESISPDLVATAISVRDKSLETVLAHWIAHAVACNQRRDDEAARLLETCLQHASFATPPIREVLIGNAAIFQAKRKRPDLARQWRADLHATLEVPYRRLMIDGAILEAEGDFLGALRQVEEIESVILATTEPARQQISLRAFAKWKAELQGKAGLPVT